MATEITSQTDAIQATREPARDPWRLAPYVGNQPDEAAAEAALQRLASETPGPLLTAERARVLYLHFAVPAHRLADQVPFELQTRDGLAFVSVVSFDQADVRIAIASPPGASDGDAAAGDKVSPHRLADRRAAWVTRRRATHRLLQIQACVSHADEPAAFIMGQWTPHRGMTSFGPRAQGLAVHTGQISHDDVTAVGVPEPADPADPAHAFHGAIVDQATGRQLRYRGAVDADAHPALAGDGSLAAFLVERYTALTHRRGVKRRFRLWHEPLTLRLVNASLDDASLLKSTGPWIDHAELIGAHLCPDPHEIWIGRPQCINGAACAHPWQKALPA